MTKASSASSSSRTETSDNPKTLYSQGLSYKSQNKDTQAFECFKKAAEMGHTRAQYELALCYKDGKGVSKNETETGKGLYGVVNEIKEGGKLADCENILFIHTGGLFGLFPNADLFTW